MTNPMMIKLMLLSVLVTLIGADDTLIQKECNQTNYQITCLNCLKSDRHSDQADRLGLTEIILNCLGSELDILTIQTRSLLKGESDEAIKKILVECKYGFSNATEQVIEAVFDVGLKKYDEAITLVNHAVSYPLTCSHNLQDNNFKESPELFDEILLYGKLSSAAKTMIQRLYNVFSYNIDYQIFINRMLPLFK